MHRKNGFVEISKDIAKDLIDQKIIILDHQIIIM